MIVTRRAVLGGGLALGAAALLGSCSSDDPLAAPGTTTDPAGATFVTGRFRSRFRRAETGWTICYPPGHDGAALPVLVTLHCRGGDHTTAFTKLRLDRYLADAVRHGTAPFAIAAVDGGEHSYWHPRSSGDPAGMVIHEFLPLLARHGLQTARVGLFGWSMGGYGALYLGERLTRQRVAVLVAESPAIWHHSYQVVEGSFDGAADWRRHDIWPHLDRLRGIAVRLDCGASDGFQYVTEDLRDRMHPRPAGGIEPGNHDSVYWRSQAPAQLRFVGRKLR